LGASWVESSFLEFFQEAAEFFGVGEAEGGEGACGSYLGGVVA
jgi:hypothetical protein